MYMFFSFFISVFLTLKGFRAYILFEGSTDKYIYVCNFTERATLFIYRPFVVSLRPNGPSPQVD